MSVISYIILGISAKKEAKLLVAELEQVYDRLALLHKETGLRLFGLGDVEEGLRYLKGEKKE
jgi:hypothetical protein